MELSAAGAIDIISREAIILEPYLDSVGVWTIGIGRTKIDGRDPREFGKITIDQAIDMFRQDITRYTDAVKAIGKPFNQFQFDALSSACYNFGEGNLRTLCRNRSVEAIGQALMLYCKPPEITGRRRGEQRLYQEGLYACRDGKVLVAPVGATHHPLYSKGYTIDVRPYFGLSAATTPVTDEAPVHSTLWLQQALNRLGADPHLAEDGLLGPVTRQEILDYQTSKNLAVDGIAGRETWTAIESDLSKLEDMKKAA